MREHERTLKTEPIMCMPGIEQLATTRASIEQLAMTRTGIEQLATTLASKPRRTYKLRSLHALTSLEYLAETLAR